MENRNKKEVRTPAKTCQLQEEEVLLSPKKVYKTPCKEALSPISTPRASLSCKADRFIPCRKDMDLDVAHFTLLQPNEVVSASPGTEKYKDVLAETLFDGKLQKSSRILSFKEKAPLPKHSNPSTILYSCSMSSIAANASRVVAKHPTRILDAPNYVDDYYLNLIDWSSTDRLCIALSHAVHIWNAATCEQCILTRCNSAVCSVKWTQDGRNVAIGTDEGTVQIWDVEQQKLLRRLYGHSSRVSCLAWNSFTLSTGSKDASINNHDVRIRESLTHTLQGHEQEICGLKWSSDDSKLASGANDNVLNVWEKGYTTTLFSLTEHCSAVKAIAWCPWQRDLLASGGGIGDRSIKFWSVSSGKCLNSIATDSQVSQLVWSPSSCYKELLSAHGFSKHQLTLWKYPSMTKVTELKEHSQRHRLCCIKCTNCNFRILSLAQSPDGKRVVSAGADEQLCFWDVFQSQSAASRNTTRSSSSTALLSCKNIRHEQPLVFRWHAVHCKGFICR